MHDSRGAQGCALETPLEEQASISLDKGDRISLPGANTPPTHDWETGRSKQHCSSVCVCLPGAAESAEPSLASWRTGGDDITNVVLRPAPLRA